MGNWTFFYSKLVSEIWSGCLEWWLKSILTCSFHKPMALTAFAIVTKDNWPLFVPFNSSTRMPADAPCGDYLIHTFIRPNNYLNIICFRWSGWVPERLCIRGLGTAYVDLLVLLRLIANLLLMSSLAQWKRWWNARVPGEEWTMVMYILYALTVWLWLFLVAAKGSLRRAQRESQAPESRSFVSKWWKCEVSTPL